MSEKNLWRGFLDTRTDGPGLAALVEAMGLYGDVRTFIEHKPGMTTDFDLGKTDSYGSYFDERAIPPLLVALNATGWIHSEFLVDYSEIHFEAMGGSVRVWYSVEEAMVAPDFKDHIRFNGKLYQITEVIAPTRNAGYAIGDIE